MGDHNQLNENNFPHGAKLSDNHTLLDTHKLLEVDTVSKTFRDGAAPLHVLDRVSLTVGHGEFVSIVGPSGSGKSTVFHIIGGLTQPDEGVVRIDGIDITGERGHISYMPQQPALFPWRTVQDNVIMAMEVLGVAKRDARQKAQEWLAKVGLEGFEKAYPHTLSGGMQQRVAFLRALLSPKELMCLDEPFSALDALTRLHMQRWLLNIWETNKRSILFITHNIEEALLLSDTIYLFSNKPATVLERIEVPFARPREEALLSDPQFVAMKQHIYEQMRAQQVY